MSFKTSNDTLGLIAVDDGGSTTCVMTKNGKEKFDSVKGLYGVRNLATKPSSKYDFIVEYLGEKYVMGSLAKFDCELPMEMHTKSKCNLFFDLSILVSIHQYGFLSNYVIVSAPLDMFTKEEQEARINRLKKSHTITVNDVTKTFSVTDIKLAPEAASAYWYSEPGGVTHYIDVGSRTVNYATIRNEDGTMRYINSQSGTFFNKGLEALDNQYDARGLADYICGRLIKSWGANDKVYLLGGGALDDELVKHIKGYFKNAEIMDEPQMANVKGMYTLGRNVYGVH